MRQSATYDTGSRRARAHAAEECHDEAELSIEMKSLKLLIFPDILFRHELVEAPCLLSTTTLIFSRLLFEHCSRRRRPRFISWRL